MLKLLIYFLFLTVYLKNTMFWVFLLQTKEYRADRLKDYFSTAEGKQSLFNKSFLIEIFGLILFLLMPKIGPGIIIAILVIELFLLIRNWRLTGLLKPVLTAKAAMLVSLTFITGSILAGFFSTITNSILWYLLINALTLIIAVCWLIIILPITFLAKKKFIFQATKKIKQYPTLKIVGITGSYGKTSVKEYTSDLLAGFFKIVKTAKNNNSEMGVAKTILKNNFSHCDIFIAEMGAYKKNEIANICRIAEPQIAVISGIDEQHSSLFGGLSNTIKTKAEILQTAKIAIINYDNQHALAIPLREGLKSITYGIKNKAVDLRAVLGAKEGIWQKFQATYKDQAVDFLLKLPGEHNVLNVLAALGVCLALGLKLTDLVEPVKNLQSPEATLELIEAKGQFILNDSYNANPTGVIAAIKTLNEFTNDKVIILDDILELGENAKKIHMQIAAELSANQFSKIILIGKNYGNLIYNELVRIGFNDKLIMLAKKNSLDTNEYLNNLPGNHVILFEGRGSKKYLKLFV